MVMRQSKKANKDNKKHKIWKIANLLAVSAIVIFSFKESTTDTSQYSLIFDNALEEANNAILILSLSSHQSQVVIPNVIEKKNTSTLFTNSNEIVMSNECSLRQDKVHNVCTEFFLHSSCQKHEREIIIKKHTMTRTASALKPCRTLWFAGFHEGDMSKCNKKGYRYDYATALSSWEIYANDVLQPVLLLGRLGLNRTKNISPIRKWAVDKGAIVVTVDKLSFHNEIMKWHNNTFQNDFLMGPYMRLDIPAIIKSHNLFNLPGICKQHILYTDADIMFVNPITHYDIQDLILQMATNSSQIETGFHVSSYRYDRNAFVMYGREFDMNHPIPFNTGVMVMNVPRFSQELPRMIQFRNEHPNPDSFAAFDQGWLNLYFEKYDGVALLPLYWNWKLYWKLQPSLWSDMKIIHFHGPKPETGLRKLVNCTLGENIHDTERMYVHGAAYISIILNSICCDESAKMASYVLQLYDLLKPPQNDVC